MRSLPPFDALLAFDATLTEGSVSRAAAALGITQSAVSHRLRRLDAFFGMPLLARAGRRFVPTPAGAALSARLPLLLDELAGLRTQCRAVLQPEALRIGLGAALADNWLVRRLPSFQARHPELAVELVILKAEMDAVPIDLDLQIPWVPRDRVRALSTQKPLFIENVFPVAAPGVLPGDRPLRDVRGLLDLPLLHKGTGPGAGAEWLWQTWFSRFGLGAPPRGLHFETIGTAIAAALQGAGIALARSLLVHDALREGRLLRALPPEWDMPSSKVHVLRWPAALMGDRRILAFGEWIAAEAEKAGHRGDGLPAAPALTAAPR